MQNIVFRPSGRIRFQSNPGAHAPKLGARREFSGKKRKWDWSPVSLVFGLIIVASAAEVGATEPIEYKDLSLALSLVQQKEIWPNEKVAIAVSASGMVGIKTFRLVFEVSPSSAFVLDTEHTSFEADSRFTLPFEVEFPDSGHIQVSGIRFGSGIDGSAVLGTITFTTSDRVLPGTEITVALAGYVGRSSGDYVVRNASANFSIATNAPPVLSDGAVTPITGNTDTSFVFKVTYKDADNDPPSAVTMRIDGGASISMVNVRGTGTYSSGVVYEYRTMLPAGVHSYAFAASDGVASATGDVSEHLGLTVNQVAAQGPSTGALAGPGSSPWPMEGHDQRNTRQSTNKGPDQGIQLEWRYQMEGDAVPVSTPTIGSDGTVYVAASDGYLYALQSTGSLKWRFSAAEGTSTYFGVGVGGDGTVYVSAQGKLSYVYAIDAQGSTKWKYQVDGASCTPPVIGSDGKIYVMSWYGPPGYGGHLYALNNIGTLQWKYDDPGKEFHYNLPAIGRDGEIYVSSSNNIFTLTSSGVLKWKWGKSPVDPQMEYAYDFAPPAIGTDGTIYVGSSYIFDSHVYAFTSGGTIKWDFKEGDEPIQGMAIGKDGNLYVPSGGLFRQKVQMLSPDGILGAQFDNMDLGFCSAPITDQNGVVYLATYSSGEAPAWVFTPIEKAGYLYGLSPFLNVLWKYKLSAGFSTSPVLGSDGTLYVGANDGGIYAFSAVYAPVLSEGKIAVTVGGDPQKPLTLSVLYTDADNNAPSTITVEIDYQAPVSMTKQQGQGNDYSSGVVYEYRTNLPKGIHVVSFAAGDGQLAATGDTEPHVYRVDVQGGSPTVSVAGSSVFTDGFEEYQKTQVSDTPGSPWIRFSTGDGAEVGDLLPHSGGQGLEIRSFLGAKVETDYVQLNLPRKPSELDVELWYDPSSYIIYQEFASIGLGLVNSKFTLNQLTHLGGNEHNLSFQAPGAPEQTVFEELEFDKFNYMRTEYDFSNNQFRLFVGLTKADAPLRATVPFDGTMQFNALYLTGGVNSTYIDDVQVTALGSYGPPDLSPPLISAGPTAVGVRSISATLSWSTDEKSSSIVEYGTTTSYGLSATGVEGTSHFVTIDDLAPGTTYHYRVGSVDAAGNGPAWSGDQTFITRVSLETTKVFADDFEGYSLGLVSEASKSPWVRLSAGDYANVDSADAFSGRQALQVRSFLGAKVEMDYVKLNLPEKPSELDVELWYKPDGYIIYQEFADIGLGWVSSKFSLSQLTLLDGNGHSLWFQAPGIASSVEVFSELEFDKYNYLRTEYDFSKNETRIYVGVAKSDAPLRAIVSFDGTMQANALYLRAGANVTTIDDVQVTALGRYGEVPSGLRVSADSLAMKNTSVGATNIAALTVTNNTTEQVAITAANVNGVDASQFRVSPSKATMAPGKAQIFSVTFSPTSVGTKTATIGLAHSAGIAPLQVALRGTGLPTTRSGISISATTVEMGYTRLRSPSRKYFTITNVRSDTLRISGVQISGANANQYRVTPTRIAIAPGKGQTFAVVFTPTSVGDKSATLTITHSAGKTPLTVSLQGVGIQKGPAIQMSASSLSADNATIGTTVRRTFTATNTGDAPLIISRVNITGQEASQFMVSPKTAAIAPGQKQVFTVEFQPTTTKAAQASIEIFHNASGGQSTIAVKGSAAAGTLASTGGGGGGGGGIGETTTIIIIVYGLTDSPAGVSKPLLDNDGHTPNHRAMLNARQIGNQLHLSVDIDQTHEVQGYGLMFHYDPQALQYREIRTLPDAGQAEVQEKELGSLILARAWGAGANSGPVEMVFEMLGNRPDLEVTRGLVLETSGDLVPLQIAESHIRVLPERVALEPNFPNPFNPETTIRYQLPTSAQVRLEIYDLLGQQVRTLVSQVQEVGYYRVIWDGRDNGGNSVASAVYFYHLQAGTFSETRKLLLMK